MQAAIVKNIAIDILATNVRHFGPTYSNTKIKLIFYMVLFIHFKFLYKTIFYLPKIYIIVKQLSNANPTINRKKANEIKLNEYADAIPPMKPSIFVPTNAGIRPYRSAITPNRRPPTMAPQKNID